ncbi:MAG: hypothetical protein ACTSPY_15050 [Candidatus Helarchaeota archaeon]
MIHSLWILKDGICLLQLNCGCFEINPHLFTGFLSALSSFTQETIKQNINIIVLEDLKFIFDKNNDLYFILCSEKLDNNVLLHKILIRIQIQFLNRYYTDISNWSGEISKFIPFGEIIDKIISCSVQGTKLFCENCEKIIPGTFTIKNISSHDFYFCCKTCQKDFEESYLKFIHCKDHFESF